MTVRAIGHQLILLVAHNIEVVVNLQALRTTTSEQKQLGIITSPMGVQWQWRPLILSES